VEGVLDRELQLSLTHCVILARHLSSVGFSPRLQAERLKWPITKGGESVTLISNGPDTLLYLRLLGSLVFGPKWAGFKSYFQHPTAIWLRAGGLLSLSFSIPIYKMGVRIASSQSHWKTGIGTHCKMLGPRPAHGKCWVNASPPTPAACDYAWLRMCTGKLAQWLGQSTAVWRTPYLESNPSAINQSQSQPNCGLLAPGMSARPWVLLIYDDFLWTTWLLQFNPAGDLILKPSSEPEPPFRQSL
jgi:hypothetical protein